LAPSLPIVWDRRHEGTPPPPPRIPIPQPVPSGPPPVSSYCPRRAHGNPMTPPICPRKLWGAGARRPPRDPQAAPAPRSFSRNRGRPLRVSWPPRPPGGTRGFPTPPLSATLGRVTTIFVFVSFGGHVPPRAAAEYSGRSLQSYIGRSLVRGGRAAPFYPLVFFVATASYFVVRHVFSSGLRGPAPST
jgi:hypothetical protein